MRKALLTLTIIIVSALTGCGGSVWANRRPVETLLPVQTVGLDAAGAALELTVSAPEEPGGAAALLSASGGSLEEAAAALLPRRWGAWRVLPAVLLGVAVSCGVEQLQYLHLLGTVETDDVLCNGFGALLGGQFACIAPLLRRIFPKE